jgi:hypothetical protein
MPISKPKPRVSPVDQTTFAKPAVTSFVSLCCRILCLPEISKYLTGREYGDPRETHRSRFWRYWWHRTSSGGVQGPDQSPARWAIRRGTGPSIGIHQLLRFQLCYGQVTANSLQCAAREAQRDGGRVDSWVLQRSHVVAMLTAYFAYTCGSKIGFSLTAPAAFAIVSLGDTSMKSTPIYTAKATPMGPGCN